MSPVSRTRKPKKNRNRAGAGRTASPFAPLLADAASLVDETSVLTAEWWASQQIGGIGVAAHAKSGGDPQRFLERELEGFIEYLGGRDSPPALAALRALALVGDDWSRELAAAGADRLAAAGVPEPAWNAATRPAELVDAHSAGDLFGEIEVIVLGFRRTDTDHNVVVMLDHSVYNSMDWIIVAGANAGGAAGIIGPLAAQRGLNEPVELSAAEARLRLEDALDRYLVDGPDLEALADNVEDDPAFAWALLRARLDTLPDDLLDYDGDEDDESIVADFLASQYATTLPDRDLAERFARFAVDTAIDVDRDPSRFGPGTLSDLLLVEMSEHLTVDEADLAALPAVVTGWAHFTADVRGLGAAAHRHWDEKLPDLLKEFAETYADADMVEHRATCPNVLPFHSYGTGTDAGLPGSAAPPIR